MNYLPNLLLQFVKSQTLLIMLLENWVEPRTKNGISPLRLLQIERNLVNLILVIQVVLAHALFPGRQRGAVIQINRGC